MPVVIGKARNDVFRAPKPVWEATLRDELQGTTSEEWSFHLSDE